MQIHLTFALGRDIVFILWDSKQICPLLLRDTLSLASKTVCSTNVLEEIVGASAYKIRRNIRDSWRTAPNNSERQASEVSVVPWLGFLYPVGNGQTTSRLPTKSGIP